MDLFTFGISKKRSTWHEFNKKNIYLQPYPKLILLPRTSLKPMMCMPYFLRIRSENKRILFQNYNLNWLNISIHIQYFHINYTNPKQTYSRSYKEHFQIIEIRTYAQKLNLQTKWMKNDPRTTIHPNPPSSSVWGLFSFSFFSFDSNCGDLSSVILFGDRSNDFYRLFKLC